MKFKRILKYLLFFILILSLGFLYSFSLKKNKQKKVKDIIVEFKESEHNFLTHAMVNKLLIQNKETIKNKAKSVIDLYAIESNVSKNPYVEEASVYLTIDGALKTTIKQRNPIVRVVNKDSSYYVDEQGVVVPLSSNYSARVMLVSGVNNNEELKEMLPLIKTILEDKFLKKEIVGIQKSDANEFYFAVRSGDYKIDFGKLTEIDVKFKKLKAFYNKTFVDKSIKNYKMITVKYHNQVVCTK